MVGWEERLEAMKWLADYGDISLKMRKPGDWYVEMSGVEWKPTGSGCLEGAYGNGTTPEDAVNDHWEHMTRQDGYLVLNAMRESRRHLRWNGWMFVDITKETLVKTREDR